MRNDPWRTYQRVLSILGFSRIGGTYTGVKRGVSVYSGCDIDNIRAFCRDICRMSGSRHCGDAGFHSDFFTQNEIQAWCRSRDFMYGNWKDGGKSDLFWEGILSVGGSKKE